MLEQELRGLNFSDNETAVYLDLIEIGVAGANELSKSTGISRTTVYSVLNTLIDRGLVNTEKQAGGATLFIAGNPQALLRSVEREKTALLEKERRAKELVEAIQPFFP